MTQHPPSTSHRTSSVTAALWCCAALLGLNLLLGGGMGRGPEAASAQNQPGANVTDPPFNAADQRKRMIEQLVQLNDRMSRIEAKLDKGVAVKVTEMPAAKKE